MRAFYDEIMCDYPTVPTLTRPQGYHWELRLLLQVALDRSVSAIADSGASVSLVSWQFFVPYMHAAVADVGMQEFLELVEPMRL